MDYFPPVRDTQELRRRWQSCGDQTRPYKEAVSKTGQAFEISALMSAWRAQLNRWAPKISSSIETSRQCFGRQRSPTPPNQTKKKALSYLAGGGRLPLLKFRPA